MNTIHRGNWLQTYSGKAFYIMDPKPEDICIIDIASALSKQCRYAGHCINFYSVAEHCVHVADKVDDKFKLTALMHDASEAYLVDLPRPIKKQIPQYKVLEAQLEQVIANKYKLIYPFPKEVMSIDNRILMDERIQNMGEPPMAWDKYEENDPIGVKLGYWEPSVATRAFINSFYMYGGKE